MTTPNDPAARRARLLERQSQLSDEKRKLLDERLRGAAASTAAPMAGRCLVEITPASPGSRPPLFCVHPAGGDVLCFFPLARHTGPDQPFFGLQAKGYDDDSEPFATLEEMATHYVAEIRKVQPSGPYHLGGWSFGGLAAYEMARQLAEAGQEVRLLAVLDTAPGVTEEERRRFRVEDEVDDTPWLMTIGDYVQGLRGVSLNVTFEELAPMEPEARLAAFVEHLLAAGIVHSMEDGLVQLRRLLRVYRANVAAYRAYQPKPYPGSLTLFRATGGDFDPALGADLGWGEYTGRPVEVLEVPGHHISLLAEPNVGVLAERLRAAIDA
jgi:thioesterase domain-containing protein